MTTLVEIPARDVLTVDGVGAPEDAPFSAAVRALFAVRAALGARDDVPLEGSYAQDGDPMRFDLDAPHGWHWRLLLPAPEHAKAEAVGTAAARFGAPVLLRSTRPSAAAELLHHGPYADEGPSLAALYAFVAEQGLAPAGAHTEVYLTDPREVEPSALRTLLRVPVMMPPPREG
jgi:hypothetical protein